MAATTLKRKHQPSVSEEEGQQPKRLRMDRKRERDEEIDQSVTKCARVATADEEYPHFGLRKRQRMEEDSTTDQPRQKRQHLDDKEYPTSLVYWGFNHFLKQLHLENIFVKLWHKQAPSEPSSVERDLLGPSFRTPIACH